MLERDVGCLAACGGQVQSTRLVTITMNMYTHVRQNGINTTSLQCTLGKHYNNHRLATGEDDEKLDRDKLPN